MKICDYCTCRKTEELPNIVLLMGDDHVWNKAGYNGHPFVKTPVLDEIWWLYPGK